jgi:UDP-N-acetylglucosamine--N-acetylmuramyl-(pentapeptide) pyrophosphoryl-undecaprenol N-acetylglucosamine transferase
MKVLIVGGGTGGHLFPGIAIAETFLARNPENQVRFISTRRALDQEVLAVRGFPSQTIEAEGIKGRGVTGQIKALLKLPGALKQSFRIIREFQPHLVIGVGGYVSGPVVLAGRLQRVPTVIQEQNSIPGLTNRILALLVDRIFYSFEKSREYFPARKSFWTGNPVRRELKRVLEGPSSPRAAFTVLVLGGSQGAHRLNQLLTEALDFLGALKKDLSFIHQTGTKDEDWVRQVYREKEFSHEVQAFIPDMVWAYSQADMLICRSGATTLAEITALGKASLLIPFPFATNNHQEENARSLVRQGAAEMIPDKDLTAAGLATIIQTWRIDPRHRADLADRARTLGRWQAAEEIVASCTELVRGKIVRGRASRTLDS